MAFLAKGAWVVVADASRAMVLENMGDAQSPQLRQVAQMQAEVMEATDKPGRMPDPGPGQRSAMEQTDLARLGADRMVSDLADRLGTAARDGRFDQLIFAAPPQVLGAFRAARCDAVSQRLVAEMDKTLTGHSLPRIADLVCAELARPH
ncbi:host attachment family protein [Gemmobacter fulvus]|uniref:host attachment family protein n=1 Tax=Gemmobacter fulvus TaxID=2840474 RepID=UPI002796CC58|nr:host attachment family protein [Gemmobacter fulvus]MDQ1849131.1 host attachment family protein [Gemmobacter fulvus]